MIIKLVHLIKFASLFSFIEQLLIFSFLQNGYIFYFALNILDGIQCMETLKPIIIPNKAKKKEIENVI
jgi:hypothetical protein